MPRKNQKKSSKSIPNKFKIEIYGMLLLAFSVLIGFSIYIEPSGIVGVWVRNFFFALFGIATFLIPIIMLISSIIFISNKGYIKFEKKLITISLFIFNIVAMIHTGYSVSSGQKDFASKVRFAAEIGMNKKGGGVVSEIITSPLLYMFGTVGVYIILIFVGIILAMIITKVSLVDLCKSIVSKISESFKDLVDTIKIKAPALKSIKIPTYKDKEETPKHEEAESKNDNNISDEEFATTKIEVFDSLERNEKNESQVDKSGPIIESNFNNKEYIFPSIELLRELSNNNSKEDKKQLLENAKMLEDTLQSFNVDAKVIQVRRGPSVTRYELHPSPGVKVSKIVNLADDLALSLATSSVRIEAPIPGKAAVGIEVPNKEVLPVSLREVIESHEFSEYMSNLSFALGKDITGKCIVADIGKMPHLLIAGATGSGKSVCINTLITSLVYKSSPEDVRMILIDPKVVELSIYNGIPHLLIPVVTDPKKAASALYWAVNEMTERYKMFAENNVRNIDGYNNLVTTKGEGTKMPKIVIVIDELADLMMVSPRDVEDSICRLAQMARAAGIHLVIATQRPSVDIITGVIKANIPSRISFGVSSQTDSRTILDMGGAEKLLGRGDMLFLPIGESKPVRIQGAFISEEEVESIVKFLKESSSVEYSDEAIEKIDNIEPSDGLQDDDEDVLLKEAIQIAVDYGQASASMLQRRLRIGFNRAARLLEVMETRGVVGPQEGSKPRQVLINKEDIQNF